MGSIRVPFCGSGERAGAPIGTLTMDTWSSIITQVAKWLVKSELQLRMGDGTWPDSCTHCLGVVNGGAIVFSVFRERGGAGPFRYCHVLDFVPS